MRWPGRASTPTAVVHGAMRRQRDTATAMVEGGGWSVTPELDEGWNEFDHLARRRARALDADGEVGDSTGAAFQRVFEEATARWSGGEHDDEYDESWPAFVARATAALDRAFARDGVTVVVSSGGPIAAVVRDPGRPDGAARRRCRGCGTRSTPCTPTPSVTRVLEGSTGRRLLSFNEHSHLPRELVTYR